MSEDAMAASDTINQLMLDIPCLPNPDLSANGRRSRHFMEQAEDIKTERLAAALILKAAKPDIILGPPLGLHWTLYWPKGTRARDADACADMIKPWIDAMKDIGWLPNDSPRYVRTVSYTSVPSSPKGPSMTLTIEQDGR